jgi:hypothetical protein
MKLMPVYQVGKGLSKDEKAQKLALQHWLEAVLIVLIAFLVYPLFNEIKIFTSNVFFFGLLMRRLIQDIGTAITSISTMIPGFTVKANSLSSTGMS